MVERPTRYAGGPGSSPGLVTRFFLVLYVPPPSGGTELCSGVIASGYSTSVLSVKTPNLPRASLVQSFGYPHPPIPCKGTLWIEKLAIEPKSKDRLPVSDPTARPSEFSAERGDQTNMSQTLIPNP